MDRTADKDAVKKMRLKQFFMRLAFVAALAAVAGWMLVIGRGHTVYFDNKTLEWNGETYATPYRAVVLVHGEQAAKLYARERGMCTWIGQDFHMTLNLTEERGGEETTREIRLRLPYAMDGVLLNLPGLLAGLPEEAYLTEFVAVPTTEDLQEETPEGGDEMGMEGMDAEF